MSIVPSNNFAGSSSTPLKENKNKAEDEDGLVAVEVSEISARVDIPDRGLQAWSTLTGA